MLADGAVSVSWGRGKAVDALLCFALLCFVSSSSPSFDHHLLIFVLAATHCTVI